MNVAGTWQKFHAEKEAMESTYIRTAGTALDNIVRRRKARDRSNDKAIQRICAEWRGVRTKTAAAKAEFEARIAAIKDTEKATVDRLADQYERQTERLFAERRLRVSEIAARRDAALESAA